MELGLWFPSGYTFSTDIPLLWSWDLCFRRTMLFLQTVYSYGVGVVVSKWLCFFYKEYAPNGVGIVFSSVCDFSTYRSLLRSWDLRFPSVVIFLLIGHSFRVKINNELKTHNSKFITQN